MLRCAIALLLINTFYCSFGYPVNNTNVDLGRSLQLLANKCGDTFLSTRIMNISEICNITLYAEKDITEPELQCLLFYDINTQLCTTLQGSKQNLTTSYISSMNQPQNVDETCKAASKNWKFSNLTEHSKYYNTSEKVFKSKLKCIKACGVEDIYSEDTNFFCKYYHWGSELILVNENKNTAISEENDSASPQPKFNDNQKNSQMEPPSVTLKDDVENNDKLPLTITKQTEQQEDNDAEDDKGQNKNHPTDQNSVINKTTEVTAKNSSNNSTPSKPNSESDQVSKIKLPLLKHPDKPQNDGDNQQMDNPNDDEGESLDGFSEDNDDSDVDPNNTASGKSEDQKNDGGILSLSNGEIPQKEMYSNTITNQYVEEDDHFFSFFLTAIILVIFFYILYHNKSKFRKVFLGLLVEGRQPGRRRNSRGHEYRRLDTLEQAMSTNSSAPPCKIIY